MQKNTNLLTWLRPLHRCLHRLWHSGRLNMQTRPFSTALLYFAGCCWRRKTRQDECNDNDHCKRIEKNEAEKIMRKAALKAESRRRSSVKERWEKSPLRPTTNQIKDQASLWCAQLCSVLVPFDLSSLRIKQKEETSSSISLSSSTVLLLLLSS